MMMIVFWIYSFDFISCFPSNVVRQNIRRIRFVKNRNKLRDDPQSVQQTKKMFRTIKKKKKDGKRKVISWLKEYNVKAELE